MINVINSCSETVWPGVGQVSSSPGKIMTHDAGFELAPGVQKVIYAPADWVAGRVFARTGCTGSGDSFTCAVGDCGAFACGDSTGVSGVTLAEFSYSEMVKTFYNISLISGYNVGMKITPTDDTCPTFDCPDGDCSDQQAYRSNDGTNPCAGCGLNSGFTVEFCPRN